MPSQSGEVDTTTCLENLSQLRLGVGDPSRNRQVRCATGGAHLRGKMAAGGWRATGSPDYPSRVTRATKRPGTGCGRGGRFRKTYGRVLRDFPHVARQLRGKLEKHRGSRYRRYGCESDFTADDFLMQGPIPHPGQYLDGPQPRRLLRLRRRKQGTALPPLRRIGIDLRPGRARAQNHGDSAVQEDHIPLELAGSRVLLHLHPARLFGQRRARQLTRQSRAGVEEQHVAHFGQVGFGGLAAWCRSATTRIWVATRCPAFPISISRLATLVLVQLYLLARWPHDRAAS